MSDNYKSKLTEGVANLRNEFEAGRLNQEQFKFLVGYLLLNSVNTFVSREIKYINPDERDTKELTIINYARNRRLTNAS